MPGDKKSHEENLAAVCAICWNESGLKVSRGISDAQEAGIRDLVVSNYSRSDSHFPRGLCSICQSILWEWMSGKVIFAFVPSSWLSFFYKLLKGGGPG